MGHRKSTNFHYPAQLTQSILPACTACNTMNKTWNEWGTKFWWADETKLPCYAPFRPTMLCWLANMQEWKSFFWPKSERDPHDGSLSFLDASLSSFFFFSPPLSSPFSVPLTRFGATRLLFSPRDVPPTLVQRLFFLVMRGPDALCMNGSRRDLSDEWLFLPLSFSFALPRTLVPSSFLVHSLIVLSTSAATYVGIQTLVGVRFWIIFNFISFSRRKCSEAVKY